MDFLHELKRRNVYKVGAAYAVVGWLVMQVAATVVPALHLPPAITTAVVVLVLLGFPIALVLAWAFELTPEGIKRSDHVAPGNAATPRNSRKLIVTLGIVGALALGLLLFRMLRPHSAATDSSASPRAAAATAQPAEALPSKSIAVLPFQNLSKDEENAFFADGVQDEILTTLAKVADLKVISRTSVMQYRNAEKRNLPEIAQALKVAHVLEGSVQRAANRVRVTAQLIDARTDAHLWAERYDRDLADVFAIQSEIAEKIAQQLHARLSPKEKAAIESKPTQDLVAYDLYLRALAISKQSTAGRERLEEVVRLLDQAVARDPTFMAAFAGLARAHLWFYWTALDETPARLELAKDALDAAARLQPHAGEVHLARAYFHYWAEREYDTALAELAHAQRMLPNDAEVAYLAGSLERRKGRWEEATRRFATAAALDPANPLLQIDVSGVYRQQRRYAEAIAVLDRALAATPVNFDLQRARAEIDLIAYADLRRMEEAVTGEAAKSASPDSVALSRMLLALTKRDYRAAQEAFAAYRPREVTQAAGTVVPREWYEGLIALGLGEREKAEASFLAGRERAAARVAARPEDGIALVVLALIDARLGRKAEAVREADRALELLAATGDHLLTAFNTNRVAAVYAHAGETERALDLLEQGLQRPNGPSYGNLKFNEDWDPLRSHLRFQKLLEALAPRDAPR